MSTETQIAITFGLKSYRLVFRMGCTLLIVNPWGCKGDDSGRTWPHCRTFPLGNHTCKEETHGGESVSVPLTRVIDECGDSDAPWFAFWEADCMSPPISVVRAESFERAYEDFCDTLPAADMSDFSESERYNVPDGYTIASDGRYVHTENVNGCEIELISVSSERGA